MTVSTQEARSTGQAASKQVPSNEHDDCTASERTAHIRITSFVAEEQRNVVFVFSSAARRRRRCRLRPSLHSCSLPLHRRRRRRRHISFLIGAIVVTVVRRSFACVVLRLWFVVVRRSFVVVRLSSFVRRRSFAVVRRSFVVVRLSSFVRRSSFVLRPSSRPSSLASLVSFVDIVDVDDFVEFVVVAYAVVVGRIVVDAVGFPCAMSE